MNYFQRRMMHKGMGKRCPIRLSIKGIAMCLLLLAVIASFDMDVFHITTEKERELKLAALEAKKDRDEMLAVLEGRRAMITADGQQYARVEWVKSKQLIGE